MSDRNAEIWSTRLQREILALESSDDESKKIELLPPFISTVGHTLNIEGGIAKIEFKIDVEVGEETVESDDAKNVVDDATGVKKEDEGGNDEATAEDGDENKDTSEAAKEAEKELSENAKDAEAGNTTDESKSKDATKTAEDTEKADDGVEASSKPEPCVILVLDASLYWKADSSGDQSTPMCYPFQKPLAIIKSGSHLFKGGSTIQNGEEVDIDLDWTPSIHLSDAVTNVALKIRECVKRGEPLHSSKSNDEEEEEEDGLLSESLKREARESILETKKAMGAMFSSFAAKGSSIAAKGQSMKGFLSSTLNDSLSALSESERIAKQEEGEAKVAANQEKEEKKAGLPRSPFAGKGQSMKGFLSSTLGDTLTALQKESPSINLAEETKEKKVAKRGLPSIGEEIDLSDEPWNRCFGMYSCKAIRRPPFVEAAIAEASKTQEKDKEVPSSGFGGASSMFSRFAQSAKSAMEETFLMITEEYLVEFKSNRLNIGSGTVTFAIKIGSMAKLKFRREESLSLFFKEESDDPLVYMCLDSALAVQDIQKVLKRHGVKGKHTNATTQRAVQMALSMVHLIQQKEKELLDNPTVERVNEIMDLYRQTAEKFESAGDPRHAEVMAHMKRFLNQQFTTSILDGSFKSDHAVVSNTASSRDDSKVAASVPQGEIIEQPSYNQLDDDDDDDDDDHHHHVVKETSAPPVAATEIAENVVQSPSKKLNDSTMQNMDDILEEAKRDMEDLGMGNEDIDNILNSPPRKVQSEDVDDTFAELDAMLSDADKELNDLLNS